MLRLASIASLLLAAACATDPSSELTLAAEDMPSALGKADASWETAPTLHVGERTYGRARAQGRQVFPVWLDGSAAAPVALDVVASAHGEGSVRVAVLGPLVDGERAVVGAAGYGTPRGTVEMTVEGTAKGEYLVVVGSHGLATETSFDVATYCRDCDASRTDILAAPKQGALVADASRLVQMELGSVLAGRTTDVVVDVWASAPAHPWSATKVASSVASGTQVNVIVPASVAAGDDLRFVVREAGGRILDAGVTTRFAPVLAPLVRTDALLYGDIASIGASGIVGYYEGHASLSLRSEPRHVEIATSDLTSERPGQVGNGFGAFDASFLPALEDAHGDLNPNLPLNGEILSIGYLNGNGDYRRLGCFEYCNDLSGEATCTGGERACPATAW